MGNLPHNERDLASLRELREEYSDVLTDKERHGLTVMEQLLLGVAGIEIAGKNDVTPQAVSKWKKKLRPPNGARRNLSSLKKALAQRRAAKLPRRRGPRGITTWEEWTEAMDLSKEPVFELASLLIEPGATIGVLAIRWAPGFSAKAESDFLATGVDVDAAWTELSVFDRSARETFRELTSIASVVSSVSTHAAPTVKPVRLRFPKGFGYYVLGEGSRRTVRERMVQLFPDGDRYRIIPTGDRSVLRALENILYQLSQQRSCAGAFPTLERLRAQTAEFAGRCGGANYLWEVRWGSVEEELKRKILAWNYYASASVLFEANPWLWKRLPYQAGFGVRTISLRPHQKKLQRRLDEPAPQEVVTFLPEFVQPSTGLVRDHDGSPGTSDSSGPSTRFRNLRFVYAPLEGIPSQPETGRLSPIPATTCLVTLVRRHFLMPRPPIPLEQLSRLAAEGGRATVTRHDSEGMQRWVLNVPYLLEAIRAEHARGVYIRALEDIAEWQWRLQLHARVRAGTKSVKTIASGQNYAADRYGRLWASSFAKILDPEQWGNSFSSLTGILQNVDADLLLAYLPADIRIKLNSAAEKWTNAIVEQISAEYWNGRGRPQMHRVIQVLPNSWRKDASKFSEEIEESLSAALSTFAKSSGRVIRLALENAQRLATAGFELRTVAVEDWHSIDKRWRFFLSEHLKHRLIDAWNREMKERKTVRKLTPDQGKKNNKPLMRNGEDAPGDLY